MRIQTRIGSLGRGLAIALICALTCSGQSGNFIPVGVPVNDTMLQNPDPADWLMWRRTLNSWGYSPLNQVNRGNVANLKLAWTRGMAEGTQEGTPLVHDGVIVL